MPRSNLPSLNTQRGLSLTGLIFIFAILAMIAMLGMKVFPGLVEYRAIKNAISNAKSTGGSVVEMQMTFNKNAIINNIKVISYKDLVISKETGEVEISFAYEEKIPLFGPVTLLIDYEGTTAKGGAKKAASE
ncbi:MAG: DUF4845 domain-containing protein [Pseudomonadota bacterium]